MAVRDAKEIERLRQIIHDLCVRAENAEAERDELREVLRDLLTLRQAETDGVNGQYRNLAQRERDAWKVAADLTHFEDGPSS
jgi:predicted RNase H-like nuclease (RuvC/YqgF family)